MSAFSMSVSACQCLHVSVFQTTFRAMTFVGKLVVISDVTSWVSYVIPQPNGEWLNCKVRARARDPLWESRGFGKLLDNYKNLRNFNSWDICHRCAKILLAVEHKMQLAYYLRNTDWFQRCSEFSFFDEPVIILFTIFY